jgi:hypothetical protein
MKCFIHFITRPFTVSDCRHGCPVTPFRSIPCHSIPFHFIFPEKTIQASRPHTWIVNHFENKMILPPPPDRTRRASLSLLLGRLIPPQYIKTFPGLLHGTSSLASLLLGNFLFIKHVLWGFDKNSASSTVMRGSTNDSAKKAFWMFTIISASITIVWYWDKVQSWQLSTTTMKEKGLTAAQLQNFNRGRGTLTPLTYSLIPLFMSLAPNSWLESSQCSIALALTTMALSAGSFALIRDYSKPLFWVYGLYPALISLMVIWHHRLSAVLLLHDDDGHYPSSLLTHMEHQSYFVISCIQVGFLLYYLYSRRLITKEFVQRVCKLYHPTMMFSYLMCDAWQFGGSGGGWFGVSMVGLPWPVVVHSVVLRLVGIVYAWKMMSKREVAGRG